MSKKLGILFLLTLLTYSVLAIVFNCSVATAANLALQPQTADQRLQRNTLVQLIADTLLDVVSTSQDNTDIILLR